MSHSDSEVRDNLKENIRKKLRIRIDFKAKRKIASPLDKASPEVVRNLKNKLKPVLDELRLLAAVNTNNTNEVYRLLAAGVNANSTDVQSRSVLHIAVSRGYVQIVRLLLQHGADPNKKDIIQNTPLHLAACSHNLEIITALISAGADVGRLDMHGRHPLELAKSKLQLLQKSWREGSIEVMKLKTEIKQIINLMISVWNSKDSIKSSENNVNNLEIMRLSINTEIDTPDVEDQISKLLLELQEIRI